MTAKRIRLGLQLLGTIAILAWIPGNAAKLVAMKKSEAKKKTRDDAALLRMEISFQSGDRLIVKSGTSDRS